MDRGNSFPLRKRTQQMEEGKYGDRVFFYYYYFQLLASLFQKLTAISYVVWIK